MWREIAYWGKKLDDAGLVSSRFGNISVRTKNGLMIKRTGVMLGNISGPEDLVEVGLYPSEDDDYDSNESSASTETPSHRAIYLNTNARAVIHAHPKFGIVESLLQKDEVVPLDTEGLPFLGIIPVVDGATGSQELYDNISKIFATGKYKGVLNRGHGSFAVGDSLADCFNTTAMIEHSCFVKYHVDLARK
jgi:L-fuculose-phosphate aldolase